jgi:tetratricopeptide (TPR) repeat protein
VQLVPVALFVGASAYGRRRRRLAGDTRYARYTRAGRQARHALTVARTALARGDGAACHDAVAAAVRDYLAAKLDLPLGAVTDAAVPRLRTAGVENAVVDEVTTFFDGTAAARFAPGASSTADLEGVLARAEGIVRALERARRLAPAAALLVLGIGLAAAAALAAEESPSALFFRGNALYSSEQYADAVTAYERALGAGVESEALHFNLGNAYFKSGDVGHAVLSYERARRLAPGDPDLAANLSYARELASDPVEEPLVARVGFPLASRFGTETLAGGAAIAWWLLWLALAAGRLQPGLERAGRVAAAVAALALVATVSSAGYRWWTLDHPTHAVVVARTDTTVRFEPSATGTAHFVAKPGTVLRVESARERWSQVVARDGRRGWIETAALATI